LSVVYVPTDVRPVGRALGARFDSTLDERLEQSRHVGAVRTSMLQDLLAGKPLEIVPLTGMIITLGRLVSVPTPVSETVFALVSQLDRENQR
ncbi:2-dehydropantoate 2-reductase, partial [Rhizobium sp. SEMIA 4085]|uniref:ketopantoate reductase family protein n=1 Tax=Rhizobium sp. SEMIA 4085 TaxID=2137761 RepID=UPI0017D18F3F